MGGPRPKIETTAGSARRWWRRTRFAGVLIAVLAIAAFGIWRIGRSDEIGPGRAGPNVLLIVMDTTRGDRCTFNGYDRPTTPRIAAFAEDAVVFRRAYVPGGWTGPTHASLFTGLRPEHHGLLNGIRLYLTQEALTVAEVLHQAGWRTAGWSSNAYVSPDLGLSQGFEQFHMLLEPPRPDGKTAARIHRLALDYMKNANARGESFFVFINDIQPHAPYAPPEEYEKSFIDASTPRAKIELVRRYDPERGHRFLTDRSVIPDDMMKIRSDLYDAEIAALDAAVGDLLDAVREANLLDDTIVIITSDHGEHFGEGGRVEHNYSLYHPILHVPLVVRIPGRMEGGRTVDAAVRLEDLAPTIFEACGVDVPSGLDGESLFQIDPANPRIVRASFGPQPPPRVRVVVPPELRRALRSVIDGRWHLVRDSAGVERLFDLDADPLEAHDLAVERPDIRDRLRELLPER